MIGPTPGIYYHYKHDPQKDINNFAYEVLGIGLHTEENCTPEDKYMVVYRPLYKTFAYLNGKMFDLRPLQIFLSPAIKKGEQVPRYTLVTDATTLNRLMKIKTEMYS